MSGEVGRRGIIGSSLTEMAHDPISFMKELQRMQMERDTKTKEERAEVEARLEAKRQQFEDLRVEAEREKAKHQEELHQEELERIKSNAVQVSMLQSRLEALHNAKLLTVRDCYQPTTYSLVNSETKCAVGQF